MTIKVGDKVRLTRACGPYAEGHVVIVDQATPLDEYQPIRFGGEWWPVRGGFEPITTPDYNDGNWHAWTGGECPVHPDSEVLYLTAEGYKPVHAQLASALDFGSERPYQIVAFRVTKPYEEPKKPREFWLDDDGDTWENRDGAKRHCKGEPALFREVL